jgi:hypothetical protein
MNLNPAGYALVENVIEDSLIGALVDHFQTAIKTVPSTVSFLQNMHFSSTIAPIFQFIGVTLSSASSQIWPKNRIAIKKNGRERNGTRYRFYV